MLVIGFTIQPLHKQFHYNFDNNDNNNNIFIQINQLNITQILRNQQYLHHVSVGFLYLYRFSFFLHIILHYMILRIHQNYSAQIFSNI